MFCTKTSILLLVGILALACPMASAAPIQLSFGGYSWDTNPNPPAGWNHLVNPTGTYTNLTDSDGNPVDVELAFDTTWYMYNTGGGTTTVTTPASNLFPCTDTEWGVTRYGFYGFPGIYPESDHGILYFSGLDTDTQYRFYIFASTTSVGTANSETEYQFAAATSETLTWNPTNNTSQYLTSSDLSPDESGEIDITVTYGENNTASNRYFIMSMIIEEVPEPTTMTLLSMGGLVALLRRRRR